jgi:hypothetical protein
MRTFLLISLLIFIPLLSSPASAADEKNALDFLPGDNFVSGWITTGNEVMASPRTMGSEFKDNELLLEYNPQWYASETYSKSDKHMTIEIYQFANTSDAWGYYQLSNIPVTNLKPSAGLTIAPYAVVPATIFDTIRKINNDYLDGYKDRFYFKLETDNGDDPSELLDIAIFMLALFPGEANPASMISLLPDRNISGGTERYIRGPAGFSTLTGFSVDKIPAFKEEWSGVAAEYRITGGVYYLLSIIEFEDSTHASTAVDNLQTYFQDKNWDTVIVPAMKNGTHPRAFSDKSFIAFWSDGKHLWLISDADNQNNLMSALKAYDR